MTESATPQTPPSHLNERGSQPAACREEYGPRTSTPRNACDAGNGYGLGLSRCRPDGHVPPNGFGPCQGVHGPMPANSLTHLRHCLGRPTIWLPRRKSARNTSGRLDALTGFKSADILVTGTFSSFVNYSPAIRSKIKNVVIGQASARRHHPDAWQFFVQLRVRYDGLHDGL